ncbi:MAG: hypothetical protein ACRDYF_00990, partial [Acidimicrobiia bacterium]
SCPAAARALVARRMAGDWSYCPGARRTDKEAPMARTPQEAFETHLASLGTGDLDLIAADYADDCIQICNSQIRRGKDGVKEGFAALLAELAAAGEIKGLEVPVRVYEDNVLYIEWWADLGDMRADGDDTFIFEDGLITVQTIHYTISKAN